MAVDKGYEAEALALTQTDVKWLESRPTTPEPTTWTVVMGGLAVMLGFSWRKKQPNRAGDAKMATLVAAVKRNRPELDGFDEASPDAPANAETCRRTP